jgi:20S proteasome alpha/beta subunit
VYESQEQILAGHWVFIPAREEIPVTFQIGIVASDGVILASDKCGSYTVRKDPGTRGDSITRKIEISPDVPYVAHCSAGQTEITDAIMRGFIELHQQSAVRPCPPDMVESLLSKSACAVWEKMYGSMAQNNPPVTHQRSGILLAYRGNLFHMSFDLFPSVKPIENKKAEGDAVNAALFFLERYWKIVERQDCNERTVKRLLPLAAHCILMAHVLNPDGVKGLEIAVCTREQCKRIDDLRELEEFSSQLDSEIAKRLGCT